MTRRQRPKSVSPPYLICRARHARMIYRQADRKADIPGADGSASLYRKSPRVGCKTALAAERNRRLRRPRSSSRLPDQARRSPLQWQRWPLQCQPQSPNLACAECWRCSSPSITLLAGICTLPSRRCAPGLEVVARRT